MLTGSRHSANHSLIVFNRCEKMKRDLLRRRSRVVTISSAVIAATLMSACEFGGPFPSDVETAQAENNAVWATRSAIVFEGKPYEFAVADGRSFAQIAPAARDFAYTAAELERATAAQTGCTAVFQGGFLDRLDGFTPDTNLRSTQEGLDSFSRWRLDLTC